MVSRKYFVAALLVSVSAVPVNAGETVLYKYDALGRLVQTTQSGDINDGVVTDLTYDPAGNRGNYKVQGSTGAGAGNETGATGSTGGSSGGETPPSFSIADANADEGDPFTFTVTKSGTVSNSYSVDYTTTAGTALAGSDYTATSGTLTFAATDGSKTISVSTIEDSVDEDIEFVYIDLSNASGGATITDAQGAGQIDDNDGGNIPPVANDDNRIMARCASIHTSLTGNDTDDDGNTPLKIVQGSLTNAPSWVTHSTTLPDSRVNIGPTPDVTATTIYTVGYTVEDTLGATDTGSLIIEVRAFGTCT